MELSKYNILKKTTGEYYLFNTFSKSVVKLTDEIGDILEKKDLFLLEDDIKKALYQNGLLVDNQEHEKEVLHNQYLKIRNNKDNIFITLLPTMKCNFRCPYCFEGSDVKNEDVEMDFETLKKAADIHLIGKKHVHITLFGGEPLLKWKQLRDFFLYLEALSKKYKFTYSSSIATNAYFLNEIIIEDLIKLFHMESFQVTIDGYEKTHNNTRATLNGERTYNRVLNNFKQLVKKNESHKLNVLLRINLLNNQLKEVEELLNSFSEQEKKKFEIYFRPIYDTKEFHNSNSTKNNDLEPFYILARERGFRTHYGNYVRFWHCEGDGGLEQIHIMPNLSIWKCVNNMDINEANIGQILPNGEVVLNKEKIDEWKKNDPFDDEKCSDCVLLPICWGGCPLNFLKKNIRTCIYEKNFDFIDTFIK